MLSEALVAERLDNLYPDALGLEFLQHKHVHGVVEQLARMSDVNRRLDLVTREHPELHSCFLDIIDCLADLILKFILDSCRSN